MLFKQADDDLSNLYFEKRVSENSLVCMAIYPVIFGWRVRGWIEGECFCHIDWCCGDGQQEVERLYSILLNILTHREESKEALDDLPSASRVKPYYNDTDFVLNVVSKVQAPYEPIKLRSIDEIRQSLR